MQRELQLFTDRYILKTSPLTPLETAWNQISEVHFKNPKSTNIINNIENLAFKISSPQPLLCSLTSVRDAMLSHMRLLMHCFKDYAKILVVSYANEESENDTGFLHNYLRQIKIKDIALKYNKNLLVLVGNSKIIFHLPISDLTIFHESEIEIRLVELGSEKQKGQITKMLKPDNNIQTPQELEEFVKKCFTGQLNHQNEVSYSKRSFAEKLNLDNFQEAINQENRSLVMFCSKTCGPCAYQMPMFQEASRKVKERNLPIKFYTCDTANEISNRSKERATPTYALFEKGKQIAKYSIREQGVSVEKLINFAQQEFPNSK